MFSLLNETEIRNTDEKKMLIYSKNVACFKIVIDLKLN